MSHFVALSLNASTRVGCSVEPFGDKLTLPAVGAGGWGLGYFRSGRVLLRIEPRDEGEALNVVDVIGDLEADVLVLHSREATVGPVRRENTHPFKFQEWLFAHNGTLAGFEEYRPRIIEAMPEFIKRGVGGDTDSEHLFHLFLAFLFDAGRLSKSDMGTEPIREALAKAVATADSFAGETGHAPSPLSLVVSDGFSMVVLSRGVPVWYSLIEGVRDCAICRVSRTSQGKPQRADHDDLRAVFVRSGTTAFEHAGFQALDDGTFLSVTKGHRVEFNPYR